MDEAFSFVVVLLLIMAWFAATITFAIVALAIYTLMLFSASIYRLFGGQDWRNDAS